MKHSVLFLCNGNTARSQMAEAIVNHLMGEAWEAFSAGTRPTGYIHPLTVQVLEEICIQHQGRSKSVEEFRSTPLDLVVTLSDSAAKACPAWLRQVQCVYHRFPGLASVKGSETDQLNAFRRLREAILAEIPPLLEAARKH